MVRHELKAIVVGGVCRILELSPYISKNYVNYTRRSHRHAWALLKRSYQVAYFSVFRITFFLRTCWRGFRGVDAVLNTRGLVCGCVNRARKFTPHARVIFLESKRVKTHMTKVYWRIDILHVVNRRGRWSVARGEV
jgi:hypothetical protein